MKYLNLNLFALIGLLFLLSCSDDEVLDNTVIPDPDPYIPFLDLGQSLNVDVNTTEESTTIIIDSLNNYSFRIVATHFVSDMASGSFIKIDLENNENVKLLNLLSPGGNTFEGPLQTVFEADKFILFDVAEENVFDWYPRNQLELDNTGWIQYHAYSPTQGAYNVNFEEGENFLVVKFGEESSEHLAWLNVVYEDTLCYVKEAYYKTNPNEDINVGDK